MPATKRKAAKEKAAEEKAPEEQANGGYDPAAEPMDQPPVDETAEEAPDEPPAPEDSPAESAEDLGEEPGADPSKGPPKPPEPDTVARVAHDLSQAEFELLVFLRSVAADTEPRDAGNPRRIPDTGRVLANEQGDPLRRLTEYAIANRVEFHARGGYGPTTPCTTPAHAPRVLLELVGRCLEKREG